MIQPNAIVTRMESVVIGKHQTIQLVLAALLAEGHVLIQDVPGVAKTLLARALARALRLTASRIQMTPDLLPADLTGTGVWDERERVFRFQPGPIFAQIVLADELNRATPRTQAGLLEAMEERTVTADGARHPLPDPFFVVATQNPLEQQGVYPLPEAQLDRFLIQIGMGYPDLDDELAIVRAQTDGHPIERMEPVADEADLSAMRQAVRRVHTDPSVHDYIVRLVRATREREDLLLGASPRASLGLHHLARALAYIQGMDYVQPDHVKQAALPVLRHRVILTPQARLAGMHPDRIILELLERVEAPMYVGE
jgi:MoxR-like ATPase